MVILLLFSFYTISRSSIIVDIVDVFFFLFYRPQPEINNCSCCFTQKYLLLNSYCFTIKYREMHMITVLHSGKK